jgi:hypothetical protein
LENLVDIYSQRFIEFLSLYLITNLLTLTLIPEASAQPVCEPALGSANPGYSVFLRLGQAMAEQACRCVTEKVANGIPCVPESPGGDPGSCDPGDGSYIPAIGGTGGVPADGSDLNSGPLCFPPPDANNLGSFGSGDISNLNPGAFSGFTPEHIDILDPAAVAGITSDQLSNLDPAVIANFTPDQVTNLDPTAIAGFNADQVGKLDPSVLTGFSTEQVANLDAAAVGGLTPMQFQMLD